MKIEKEFSRFAQEYGRYNIIQEKVAQRLVDEVTDVPQHMLDLGCGSGSINSKISWEYEHFEAVDFSSKMLELHPKGDLISCRLGDFNDEKLFESLQQQGFERIFSASALQWAEDLDKTLYYIAQLNAPISLALFTADTFKTLLNTAGIPSALRHKDELEYLINQYFRCDIEVVEYTLEFESIRDVFAYIKRSGVSGGRNVLTYKQMKQLMHDYPHKTLEFEVLFAHN